MELISEFAYLHTEQISAMTQLEQEEWQSLQVCVEESKYFPTSHDPMMLGRVIERQVILLLAIVQEFGEQLAAQFKHKDPEHEYNVPQLHLT